MNDNSTKPSRTFTGGQFLTAMKLDHPKKMNATLQEAAEYAMQQAHKRVLAEKKTPALNAFDPTLAGKPAPKGK
jgi:hypothetical protein